MWEVMIGLPKQAAYNLQAFETISRLEREDPRGTKSIVDGGCLTVLVRHTSKGSWEEAEEQSWESSGKQVKLLN